MTAQHARLVGTVFDTPVKRRYLTRLRAAEDRYDAQMKRPRRQLREAKDGVAKLRRHGRVKDAKEMLKAALARFERVRCRVERCRQRRCRRALAWLDRQDQPLAFFIQGSKSVTARNLAA